MVRRPDHSVSVACSESDRSFLSLCPSRKRSHDHGQSYYDMAHRPELWPAVSGVASRTLVAQGGDQGRQCQTHHSQRRSPSPGEPFTDLRQGTGAAFSETPGIAASLPRHVQAEAKDASSEEQCSIQPFPPAPSRLTAREIARARIETDRAYLYSILPAVTSDTDFKRLSDSVTALIENCMFYADLDSKGARTLLGDSPVGTFLVRNSADPKFLFALTVMTERGATSVRIQYRRGFFQLDCEEKMRRKLPRFETVLDLIDFHVAQCRDGQGEQCRWLETSGRRDMVVILTRPRRHSPPSLTHLARLAVNSRLADLHLPSRSTDLLPMPQTIKNYLREYPYKV